MQNIPEKILPYWLILAQAHVSLSHLKVLLAQFSSAENICQLSATQLALHKLSAQQIDAIQHPNHAWIEKAVLWHTQDEQHHVIAWTNSLYPALLQEISCSPPILFVAADVSALTLPQLAIVGSRNPTHTGLEIAHEFGYQLTAAGLAITSGMALGIDGAGHKGAIDGNGKTIAVLGSGFLNIYPKKHQYLAKKIMAQGCLVSEFLPSAPPCADNFPRRNRIISGLSLGVLIVEAALRSGSLVTARYALEQNRDVFAIPGSIRNPTSSGCLSLIQQGATCVTDPQDILNELNVKIKLSTQSFQKTNQRTLDPEVRQVLACIENEPTSVDQICVRSKLSPQLVGQLLLQLELDGIIKEQYGYYSK